MMTTRMTRTDRIRGWIFLRRIRGWIFMRGVGKYAAGFGPKPKKNKSIKIPGAGKAQATKR